jgi:ribosome-associated translation inhibitor RaiA
MSAMIEHSLTLKGDLRAAVVRSWLERPLERLDRRLGRPGGTAAHLRVALRSAGSKRRAHAALELDVFGRQLTVGEEHSDARIALQDAFGELERRLERELGRRRARKRSRRTGYDLPADFLGGLAPWSIREPEVQPAL